MKKLLIIILFLFPLIGYAQVYEVKTFYYNNTVQDQLRIATKIPFTHATHMPTIRIEGFNFGEGTIIGINLAWYVYDGEFYSATASSWGSYTPDITLTNVDGFVNIFLRATDMYYGRFKISAYAEGMSEVASWFEEWEVTDEVVQGEAETGVGYYNKMGYLNAGSISTVHIGSSSGSFVNLNVSNVTTTKHLNVVGGSILSNFNGWREYGFYTAKYTNHLTQNAYYDGSWKSYSSGVHYPLATVTTTGGAHGNAFNVMVDNTITASNQALDFTSLFTISQTGNVILGSGSPSATDKLVVDGSSSMKGKVMIGTVDPAYTGSHLLAVNGSAVFTKVKVKTYGAGWPDYVFEKSYKLRSLSSVESFINKYKHLPDVPSAADIDKNGVDVGETQAVLLKKIEELTLYLIEQNKINQEQRNEIENLQAKIKGIENKITPSRKNKL
jgi:hypothetical protein